MRVLACGDRDWADVDMVFRALDYLLYHVRAENPEEPFVLIEGAARGADRIAGQWAEARKASHGVEHLQFHADWSRYGRGAGPERNRRQFREGRPDLVVAFHDAISESKGTKDMVEVAEKGACKVWLVRHQNSYD